MTAFETAAQMTGRPYNRRVAWIGDSRIFRANNVVSPETAHLAQGINTWLRFLTRQRYDSEPGSNYGVSGDRLDQIRARLAAALAADDAATWVVLGSTNDRSQGFSYQTSVEEMTLIRDMILDAGRVLVLLNEMPRGDSANPAFRLTGANLPAHFRFREWLNAQAAIPGCYVVDAWKGNALPGSATGDCITANYADGLHQSPTGAYVTALAMQPLFENLFTPRDILPYSNADQYDATDNPMGCLNTNPMMEGTGGSFNATGGSGVVADGYSENAGPAWTRTYSKVAVGGRQAQQIVLGGTGSTASVSFRQVISSGKLAIGDRVQAFAEVEFNAGVANVGQLSLNLLDNNTFFAGDMRRGPTNEVFPNVGALAGVMRTPVMTLTSTTLQLQFEMKVVNAQAPSATFRLLSFGVRKV